MSTHLLVVDALGFILALAGFHLAFRQPLVRSWLGRWRAGRGFAPLKPAARDGQDPLHYALIISGTMMMAFGIILFGFTTMFALAT